MNNLITVIIPIFNTQKFLRRCIESVTNQTYRNLQIILVNDGSTDNSLDICNEFKKKYNYIEVFSLETNMGVSFARNLGLEKALGKYIMFLDSDDYILSNTIEELSKTQTNDTCQIFGLYYERSAGLIKNPLPAPGSFSINELLHNNLKLLLNLNILHLSTNKLFDINVIKENNLKFDTSLKSGEDLKFVIDYFSHIDKIKILDAYYYVYNRLNPNSATRKCYNELPITIHKNMTNIQNFLLVNKVKNIDYFQLFKTDFFLYGIKTLLQHCSFPSKKNITAFKIHYNMNFESYMPKFIYAKTLKEKIYKKLIIKNSFWKLVLLSKFLKFNLETK